MRITKTKLNIKSENKNMHMFSRGISQWDGKEKEYYISVEDEERTGWMHIYFTPEEAELILKYLQSQLNQTK